MEELTLDNLLEEDQINNLFSNEEIQETSKEEATPENENTDKEESEENETTEANPETLFGELSESVGSKEETKEKENSSSNKSNPSSNFYSSIANALVEDGILQNLDEDKLSKVLSAEDFAELMTGYINSQLDEKQKRVTEALELGIEPSEIQKYESYINALNNVSEDKLTNENEEGENLRKSLIYLDCINKGFSKEKALKWVDKSVNSGTDIEDAKEALEDNKKFFKDGYDALLKQAQEAQKEQQKQYKKQAEELRTSILEEEKAFGDITLDKTTRQKVYDSIMKPIYTDPESGDKLTVIQKYELEHSTEFLKNVGLLFVLTDGFKNINKLVTDKVKKETKKSLRNLEHTLSSSGSNLQGGSLTLANNSGDNDPESLFKGWKLSV